MTTTDTIATASLQTHADTGEAMVAVAWTLFLLSTLVVGLRFWTKMFRVRHIGIDDYLMLISLICCAMHSILTTIAYSYGMGRHSHTLTPGDRLQTKKYIVACEAFAIITCMFGRLSFCAFFLCLVGPTHKKQRITIWVIIVAQVLGNTVTVIQVYTQCGKHMSALWDPAVAAIAHCQSPSIEMVFGYVQGSINCVSDFLLTLLPAYLLHTLQVPTRTKAILGFILTLSIFALAASIVKAIAMQHLNTHEDFTWNMVTLEIWCAVENNIVIITASIPTLGPLFRKYNKPTTSNQTKDIALESTKPTTGTRSSQFELHNTFSTVMSDDGNAYAPAKIDEIVVTKTAALRFSFEEAQTPRSCDRNQGDLMWALEHTLSDSETQGLRSHKRSLSDRSWK